MRHNLTALTISNESKHSLNGVLLHCPNLLLFSLRTVSSSAEESSFHFPQPQGPAPYNVPQDTNCTDEAALLSQLLENPLILEALCDTNIDMPIDEDPESSSTFTNMDTNFNHNFGLYNPDFSQVSDLQFNMLVNENQTAQSEPQDGLFSGVQVKKETL